MGPDESQIEQTISRPFYLSATEITVAQFRQFIDANPDYVVVSADRVLQADTDIASRQMNGFRAPNSAGTTPADIEYSDDLPAVSISYEDAQEFCRWMSEDTGRIVRLPTEAEWEYACRCGRNGNWHFGDDEAILQDYAWFHGNSGNHMHPVGQLEPNAWGLFDMYGNESEWCVIEGQEDSGIAAVRGGNFGSSATDCSNWSRHEQQRTATARGAFRVVMEIDGWP